jgi:hypothetical protein
VPAAVWVGAAADQVWGSCDPTGCGDRDRGWFMGVMVTAPLIPLGAWLVAPAVRPAWLARVGAVACLLISTLFVVLALAVGGVGVGALVDYVNRDYPVNLDDPDGSRQDALIDALMWAIGAAWCLLVAWGVLLVRRRLLRRYPSGSWPPSGKSMSAG